MINQQLINPKSIAVIGASDSLHKPGGKLLNNIIKGGYKGKLFAVNPRGKDIQGIKCFTNSEELPEIELGILAIPAKRCAETVDILANKKNTKAFIIISAGFSEVSEEGKILEDKIVEIVNKVNGVLIGPNCVGFINKNHKSIFTSPLPKIDEKGCDFISSSGGIAIFVIESGKPKGLKFSSIFSVGNSSQIGVEDIVEYMDINYIEGDSPKVKLLYIENINNPDKLLKHSSSLIRKGCRIAAIKAGESEEGSRAASSHTGALAGSDQAVEALFRKAGIIRCYGREQLATVACLLTQKEMKGNNFAIITHAGGPGVMLTDALSKGGLAIPKIDGKAADELKHMLNQGAAVNNPIDIIATGTAEQLGQVIDYCDNKLDFIDGIMLIFGSIGLYDVHHAFDIISEKIYSCKKPIYPVLPSISSAQEEINYFLKKGHVNFPDEVLLGEAISLIKNTPKPATDKIAENNVDSEKIKEIIKNANPGYVPSQVIHQLFDAAQIPYVKEVIVNSTKQLYKKIEKIGYPCVLKAVGPIHKTDVGGVVINIKTKLHLKSEYKRLMKIKNVKGVIIQPMIQGIELFIGAKYEQKFGHVLLFGLGGIFIEVLKDVSSGLSPLSFNEAHSMIKSTKSYKIIQGYRGQIGVNEELVAKLLTRLSIMLRYAKEIKELDINPLIGNGDELNVVDARIYIEK